MSPFQCAGTTWAEEKPKGVPEIEPAQLEDYFGVREVATGGTGAEKAGEAKVEIITLLDMKRGNNISILLSQFRDISFADIRRAVAEANSTMLSSDKVLMLANSSPTEEETALLLDFQGDVSKLGKAEIFMLEMLKLPRFTAKVKGFHVRCEFDSRIAELSGSISLMRNAIRELTEGNQIRGVLEAILRIGNFLNCGTARGNATGFKLDTLSKLKSTKATNASKVTMVQYLATWLEGRAPEFARLDEAYPSLTEALRLSFNQLGEDLSGLEAKLGGIERELVASQQDAESAKWCEAMSLFLGRAKIEVDKNKQYLDESSKEVLLLMKKFAVEPSGSGADERMEFLALLDEFVRDWKKAREDNKLMARMQKQTKAREEKKQQEALNKEEKQKRMTGLKKMGGKAHIELQVDDLMSSLRDSGAFSVKPK